MRRRQRKQRAAARRAWFLHCKGHVVLRSAALTRIAGTLAKHHSKDSNLIKSILHQVSKMEELWPWRCNQCYRINKKTAVNCVICHGHWTDGERHNTQPKQTSQRAEANAWEEWSRTWDDQQQSWEWDQRSISASRASTHSSRSAHSAKYNAQIKHTKGKGKKKSKTSSEGKGKGTGSGAPVVTSPFAPLATEMPPWPTTDAAVNALMPQGSSLSSQQAIDAVAQKREVVQALRAAYPDSANMPEDTKELIDKMEKDIEKLEKENSKATTKNLHSATKALGKAQKTLTETLEAKRNHRLRWTKHIANAAKTWENQLHEYRQQQASFQDVATKARSDIEHARSAIQSLSAKATSATLAAMPPITPISAETEENTIDVDQEAESVQQQLQSILQSCAASIGVEVVATGPTEPNQEIADDSFDPGTKKRMRSLEPFGGGGGSESVQSAAPKQ